MEKGAWLEMEWAKMIRPAHRPGSYSGDGRALAHRYMYAGEVGARALSFRHVCVSEFGHM